AILNSAALHHLPTLSLPDALPISALDDRRSTLEDPVIRRIAERHGNSPAQMMLRWHLDQGRQVIPTSAHAGRITENLDLFDVALSAEELAEIDGLDTGVRGGPAPAPITLAELSMEVPEG